MTPTLRLDGTLADGSGRRVLRANQGLNHWGDLIFTAGSGPDASIFTQARDAAPVAVGGGGFLSTSLRSLSLSDDRTYAALLKSPSGGTLRHGIVGGTPRQTQGLASGVRFVGAQALSGGEVLVVTTLPGLPGTQIVTVGPLATDHSVCSPRDASSGLATGRMHAGLHVARRGCWAWAARSRRVGGGAERRLKLG